MRNRKPARESKPASKKLLFVHSGSPKKRLTFEAASALGIQIYLYNPIPNWAVPFAVESTFTEGSSLADVLHRAADLHARVKLDGVVTFWEEDVPTCACIARHLGLPGNSPIAALDARSKYRMRRALHQAGVPVPPFRLVTDLDSLLTACREIPLPAVLKPEWGADSEWVTRIESAPQALDVFEEIRRRVRVQDCIYPYPPGRFVLEGFLEGPEVSVEGVVHNGRATLYAIIDKAKMDDSSFIERGEVTPSRLPGRIQAEVLDMVRRGIAALGLEDSGIHAEVKLTPDGPRIVEIGARMGGDCIHALVKRVYGIDLAEENIRAALGLPPHPEAPAHGCALSTTLVPDRPGRVFFENDNGIRPSPNLIEVVLTKGQGEEVLVPPEGYDNLAWISVWARNYGAAQRCLNAHTNRLERTFVIRADDGPGPSLPEPFRFDPKEYIHAD